MKSLFLTILLTFSAQSVFAEPILPDRYEHDRWSTQPRDIFFTFEAFVCSFDGPDDDDGDGRPDHWGIPEFVAYEIRRKTTIHPQPQRPKWTTDDKLYRQGLAPNDATYAVTGTNKLKEVKTAYRFVRGHLCPKAVAERISINAAYETHTLLNACPQLQAMNNGIWKELEQRCTDWADRYGRLWVITGPVFFDKKPSMWLGQNGEIPAAIPDAFFKIVIRQDTDKSINTLAFLIPNLLIKSQPLSSYLTTISRLECLTGLKFLTALPAEQQRQIKVFPAPNLWQ